MRFNVDDLVAKGLVSKKTYKDGPYVGLSILKYKNNVFWDNLWHTDARLLECRGIVVDSDDNVVVWPFTKIFNHHENGTDLPLDEHVEAVRKVNGFMASAGVYEGKLMVSTTGTLDSDFARTAEEMITSSCNNMEMLVWWMEKAEATFVFEICHPSDPHIIAEDAGAYLIGIRIHSGTTSESHMIPEGGLNNFANRYGFKRPEVVRYIPTGENTARVANFGDIVSMAKMCEHEGFVVRSLTFPYELLLKIKSPHYLTKKFLMRGNRKKWDMLWDDPKSAKKRVDEEFYELLDYIGENYTKNDWSLMESQSRREIIEKYLK